MAEDAPSRCGYCGGLLALTVGVVSPAEAHEDKVQPRVLFGEEQFVRTGGDPDVFKRSFTVPSYVSDPFTLRIINGNPDGSSRVDDAISRGEVFVDGVQVVFSGEACQCLGQQLGLGSVA